MGQEPSSLFLYGDSSIAARTIRQAIYDGPLEMVNYQWSPVILEKIPTLSNGDVLFEPVVVQAGNLIVDGNGNLVKYNEGISYLPIGCHDASCAMIYNSQDPVNVEQMVVRFQLRTGIPWSDGKPLMADDSQYSFEVAKDLYPRTSPNLITLTQSYKALDETTVEWRGVPGFRTSDYAEHFFTPLPRHVWGNIPPEDLLVSEVSTRSPMGWGPYIIQEWTTGDHITLSRNPNYFRNLEGLPSFEKLVFRFVPDGEEALAALLAGECDYLDDTTRIDTQITQLLELQESDRIKVIINTGTAWEQIAFGIVSLNSTLPALFQTKEMRQAVALCIDRQRMVEELFGGKSQLAESYVPAGNPLFNKDVKRYNFDPQAGMKLLDVIGWLDSDNDPKTPRLSQGVPGLSDNTPLEFNFLTTTEEEKQLVAQVVQESLAQCGFKANIMSISPSELFAPGPDGPLFGRNFSMAQVGWVATNKPPCYLYTTQEIPGPYPEYSRGWGGANASGYSNPEFDLACQRALNTLPEDSEHLAAHFQAQTVFSEDLPAIPLYLHSKVIAMRPDMCSTVLDSAEAVGLWDLETFDYGEGCN